MSEPLIGPVTDILADPPRLDRDETYVGVLISLWFAGLGIYLLPIATGAVGTLAESTQKLLSVCMLIGTSLALMGTTMGPGKLKITKPVRWMLGRIRGDGYTPLSLRHCYRIGAAGLWATCISLLFFTLVLLTHGSIIGSFTGLMSPIIFVCWTRKGFKLFHESIRMDREYSRLAKLFKR